MDFGIGKGLHAWLARSAFFLPWSSLTSVCSPAADEWMLFYGDPQFKTIKSKAFSMQMKTSRFRHVAWMVHLGMLEGDPTSWPAQLATHRSDFETLKEKHLIDPKNLPPEEEANLKVFNPLSTATDSPWARYFQNKELEKSIMQDIWRTHPGREFYQREWVRKAMLNCLFLFAKENGDTAYRQGMHELLAVMMYLLNEEKMTPEQIRRTSLSGNTVAWEVLDVKHIESDAFSLFRHLMMRMNPLFEVVDTRVLVQPDGAFIADKKQAEEHAIGQSAIVHRCRRIQYVLLKKHDLPLHNYLKTLGIEPQLYALRWVRLLFGREFHFADVITMWDAIFAYGNNLALVDCIAVTMLMYIREAILGREYTDAMSRLMKFPPVEDVSVFIESALRMAGGGSEGPLVMGPHAGGRITPVEKARTLVFNTLGRTTPPTAPAGPSVGGAPSVAVFASAEKLQELQESNQILARRLTAVVNVIQAQVLSEEAKLPDMDAILLSLAELKQMKDILSGSLDASDAHLLFGEKNNPLTVQHPLDLEEPKEDEEAEENKDDSSAANGGGAADDGGSADKRASGGADSFFMIAPAATSVAAAVASKSGPVAWADDDEELGEKTRQDSTTSWLGLFK